MRSLITKNTLAQYYKFLTVTILMGASVFGISAILPTKSLTVQAAFPTSRNPYQWPFSRDSIWNMPIASTAQYMDAGINKANAWQNGKFTTDVEIIGLNPSDPIKTLNGSQQVRVPSNASWGGNWNGCATFLGGDNDKLYSGQPLNLSIGGNPSWQFDTSNYNPNGQNETIKGQGIYGCHGASHLSGVGGSIRPGEISGPSDIMHALKINLYCNKYCSPTTGGYRWPAISADSYALTAGANFNNNNVWYNGQAPQVKMGSLLALKPDFNIDSLTSNSAKKLAKALMNYGGYVVDDTAWDVHAIALDEKAVVELYDSPAFDPDMQNIFDVLSVIDNSTVTSPGGGIYDGTASNRRASLAPCFVGEINCTNSVVNSSSTPPSCSPTNMVKVMPMGDSITEERIVENSFRAKEWVKLNNAGLSNKFTFVGVANGRADGSPQVPGMPTAHAGYGGYATKNFIDTPPNWGWDGNFNNNPKEAFATVKPDIVQIMLGTNDQWRDMNNMQSLDYYGRIIDNFRSTKPNIKFLLAVPPSSASNFESEVINALATQKQNASSSITIVKFAGYDSTQGVDTVDWVHNSSSGAEKMATGFAAALKPMIDSVLNCTSGISSSPTSSSPSSSASSAPLATCPITSSSTKLNGTAFGTNPSWNNNPGVTYDKALDNDISTYFDYANPDGGSVGINLATNSKAAQVCFYPRVGNDGNGNPLPPRVNGGLFQGSIDGTNYTDLATITGVSLAQWYSLPITDSTSYKYLRYLSPNGSYGNIAEVAFYADTNMASSAANSSVNSSVLTPTTLDLKVNLQGAYLANTSSMGSGLKSKNLIPLTSPYIDSPIVATSIPAGSVDWVLVEFRNTSGVSIAKKAGLLKTDSHLVESDGSSFKLPTSVVTGSYNLIVRHRSHLAIGTGSPVIITTNTINALDLTTNQNVKGNNQALLADGKYGLKFGNANGDNSINSRDRIATRLAGDKANSYNPEDINMDGNISSTDRVLSRLNYDSLESI